MSKFVQDKFIFRIIWVTKKVKSLFSLKDRYDNPSCVIYKGTCYCGESYVGETDRNFLTRCDEHDTPSQKSEPAKHLYVQPLHKFSWEILASAPGLLRKRKILEDSYIAKLQPSLNDHKASSSLKLFRCGVT